MESRFAGLRQRDTSVSMLRTKMSRRRSQSQKENRERTVNNRRQLQDLDMIEEVKPVSSKVTERLKQLERWKERKTLEKEKAKREKEQRGVFKTGLYHPKDTLDVAPLPDVPGASTRTRTKKADSCQSVRVTRSMTQQPLRTEDPNVSSKKAPPAVERSTRTRGAAVRPGPTKTSTTGTGAVRAASTRPASRPPAASAPPEKDKTKTRAASVREKHPDKSERNVNGKNPTSDARSAGSRAADRPAAPSAGKDKKLKEAVAAAVVTTQQHVEAPRPLEAPPAPGPPACQEEAMLVDQASEPGAPVEPLKPSGGSFAPAGFTFQAPAGLPVFKFEPMTPRSADAFLTPSPSFNSSPLPLNADMRQADPDKPSPPKSPRRSPPCSPPSAPCSPHEVKHDVSYFRSEMTSVTDRLTALSLHWESKVDDESIPEEMRDRMRTAVGQARLLMKERFNQFSGLVDDCDLGRGDKVTTCSDLQGFWDMVYYQVEDVNRKFDALKEAEGRGWVEEHRPPPRQRKAAKKPSAAPAKPSGVKAAAAKSRLAAVKAAMKARQQAAQAEKEGGAPDEAEDVTPNVGHRRPGTPMLDHVVFDGGYYAGSPSRPAVRRSSRLSAAAAAQPSPSTYLTPRRVTRRSLAQTPAPLPVSAQTPPQRNLPLQQTPPPPSQQDSPLESGSLCFSPLGEALSGDCRPDGGSAGQEEGAGAFQPSSPGHPLPPVEAGGNVDADPHRSPGLSAAAPPAAEPASTPSPGGSPTQPPPVSPAVSSQHSLCLTPDELPGLDFERYLQPSLAGSPSPLQVRCSDMWSPAAADVDMASPSSDREDPTTQEAAGMSPVLSLQSPQVQTKESPLLLFTPDLKDRIRQSVCPSDLMVFTPPNI